MVLHSVDCSDLLGTGPQKGVRVPEFRTPDRVQQCHTKTAAWLLSIEPEKPARRQRLLVTTSKVAALAAASVVGQKTVASDVDLVDPCSFSFLISCPSYKYEMKGA